MSGNNIQNKITFVEKIKIRNFKCFNDIEIGNFALPNNKNIGSGLNIILGKNNAGKTAFLNIFSKLKPDSIIAQEEKYSGKDVVIEIIDNNGQIRKIMNIPGGSNIISSETESNLTHENIDIVKDNRIWTAGFYNELPVNAYQTQYLTRDRFRLDDSLGGTLSYIEKHQPNLKRKLNGFMKEIIPHFSDWTIEYSSLAQRRFITYKLQNGNRLAIDESLGSGILNLFRILLSLISEKNIILIDEPEAYLHPTAQLKLLELILQVSKNKQVFFSTHSPYMFKKAIGTKAKLWIFKELENNIKIVNIKHGTWSVFPWGPSWGEINWYAYDLPTIELHNELYGFLQSCAKRVNKKYEKQLEFDNWLAFELKVSKTKIWQDDRNNEKYEVTLQIYIRNSIHHPENEKNKKYTESELKKSIKQMLDYIKTNQPCTNPT